MQISSTGVSANFQSFFKQQSSKSADFVNPNEKNDAYELALSDNAMAYMAAQRNQLSRANGAELKQHLPKELQGKLDEVQKLLNRILKSNNIDTSQEIKFSKDETGRFVVEGEHPEKERIERLLNENEDFKKLASEALAESEEHAQETVRNKCNIELEDEDEKKKKAEENEFERQMRLKEKLLAVQGQISEISGDFSISGGKINVASLSFAASVSF